MTATEPKKETTTKKEEVTPTRVRYSSLRFFDPRLGESKNPLPGRLQDVEDMNGDELATEILVKLGIAEKHSGLIPIMGDAIDEYMNRK